MAGGWLLPRLQALLVRALHVGNEQVYLGSGGWLYHRPDVDYVTGPGFLEPGCSPPGATAATPAKGRPSPIPSPAVASFAAQLSERGIRLAARCRRR